MADFSKLAQTLLREKPRKNVATDFTTVKEWLLDAVTVETRRLIEDYRVTHAVEVDAKGDVRRVLCDSTKPEDIAAVRLYSVPTCPKCVHIDALPVTCTPSAKRWLHLEMRRIGAAPVDRARFATEATAKAEREAREEAARVAAEEAKEEHARVERLRAEADALFSTPAENATNAQIAHAHDLCGLLPLPHDRAISRWYARAVEAAQRRATTRRVETQSQRPQAEQRQSVPSHPAPQRPRVVRPAATTDSRSAMLPVRSAPGVATATPLPARPASSTTALSPSPSKANRAPPTTARTSPSSTVTTATNVLMAATAAEARVRPPPDPADRMQAMDKLLRAGPWARPMRGKDIIETAGRNELPPGAIEALQDLAASPSPDATQVGRALHWVASQPAMHGVKLTCRKDRDKFSWWQVLSR